MTPTPTRSPFYLRVGGAWIQLEGVTPGVDIEMDRPVSESVSLGGVRRTQRARRVPRTWDLSYTYETAEVGRWLELSAAGLVGDVFLLDTAAARVNMLNPLDTVGRDVTQPTIVVNTVPLRTFAAAYAATMLVRAGVTYHLSGCTTQTAASVLGTYNLGAGAVNIVAPTGTGSRPFSTSFTPVTDGTVTIVVTVAGKTSGLRLTEGSVDTLGFLPGRKAVCQVSVSDPAQTLLQINDDELPLSDYKVTLREVGL